MSATTSAANPANSKKTANPETKNPETNDAQDLDVCALVLAALEELKRQTTLSERQAAASEDSSNAIAKLAKTNAADHNTIAYGINAMNKKLDQKHGLRWPGFLGCALVFLATAATFIWATWALEIAYPIVSGLLTFTSLFCAAGTSYVFAVTVINREVPFFTHIVERDEEADIPAKQPKNT